MSWNYRIIYHDSIEHPYYGLHEIYYNEDGIIDGWTIEASVVGDDKEEIIRSLELMLKDANKSDLLVESSLEKSIQTTKRDED